MASRCVKKDAATSTHRDQRLDLTEKYVLVYSHFTIYGYENNFLAFRLSPATSTPLNGSYYSITEPSHPSFTKQMNASRFHREMTLINGDVCDLTKQKEELVIRLTKQLVALTNDRTTISDQSTTNDLLGTDISSVVANKVRPSESTKFRSYVDDVGHITMLLLSLSGRLARTENSLFASTDAIEKVPSSALVSCCISILIILFYNLNRNCWMEREHVCWNNWKKRNAWKSTSIVAAKISQVFWKNRCRVKSTPITITLSTQRRN